MKDSLCTLNCRNDSILQLAKTLTKRFQTPLQFDTPHANLRLLGLQLLEDFISLHHFLIARVDLLLQMRIILPRSAYRISHLRYVLTQLRIASLQLRELVNIRPLRFATRCKQQRRQHTNPRYEKLFHAPILP